MHRFCVLLLLIWVLYVSCDIITCTSDHHYVLADDSGDIGCSSYGDRLNITWLITSSDNARRILLSFSQFDTEANYDFVSIYDGKLSVSYLFFFIFPFFFFCFFLILIFIIKRFIHFCTKFR